MQNTLFQFLSRILVVMVFSAVLAGCNQIQARSFVVTAEAAPAEGTMLPGLKQFLDDSNEHTSAVFEQTPWGEQVEVTVIERYFSGSGRDCISLEVARAVSQVQPVIVCDHSGRWESVRPVTHMLNAQ